MYVVCNEDDEDEDTLKCTLKGAYGVGLFSL
jgi:hypothetical protein